MILRLAGGVLVCLSCTLIGIYLSVRANERAKLLMEFRQSLILLKSQIEYAAYPLPQAFKFISLRLSQPLSGFYNELSEKLCVAQEDFTLLWHCNLDKLGCIEQEDIAVLNGLGAHLGNIDTDLQLNAIQIAVNDLEITLTKLNEQNIKNTKLYRSLGIISGLFITIILL